MLESADERRGGQLRLARQFDGLQAGQQLGEEAVHLHPRQRGAQTEMYTVAEGEVFVRVAADVEPVGLVEDVFVAIAGNVSQVDGFALGDRYAANGRVLRRRSHELL